MTTASIWQNQNRLVWYCTSFLSSTISHVILVAWNHAWWEEMHLGNWANTANCGFPPERKLLTRSFRAPIIQGWLAAHEWKPVNQLGCWSNSQSKGKSGPSSWIASTLLRGWHFTYWTGQNGISIFVGWQFTTDDRQAWQRTRKEHTFCPQTLLNSWRWGSPLLGNPLKQLMAGTHEHRWVISLRLWEGLVEDSKTKERNPKDKIHETSDKVEIISLSKKRLHH